MSLGRIVIVEDEAAIREAVVAALTAAGYEPIEAADGEAGLEASRRTGVDLVLLDLALPKLDGMEVLRRLRKTHPTLPVIIVTARGAEDARVEGLTSGADDYIVKPFSVRELSARIKAVLRRSPERPEIVTRLMHGDAIIDLARREVTRQGQILQSLSETESSLLSHLAANPGRAISRNELLARVWGVSGGIETRTIDMHVARLRSKLASIVDADAEPAIVTVRGKGYMLGTGITPLEGGGQGDTEVSRA